MVAGRREQARLQYAIRAVADVLSAYAKGCIYSIGSTSGPMTAGFHVYHLLTRV